MFREQRWAGACGQLVDPAGVAGQAGGQREIAWRDQDMGDADFVQVRPQVARAVERVIRNSRAMYRLAPQVRLVAVVAKRIAVHDNL